MEINVVNILIGIIGLLVGISATAFVIYPKMMKYHSESSSVNAAQSEEIKTLFANMKRHDAEIGETRQMHNKTIDLVREVINQNSILIQGIMVKK